jgi:putative membrane protein
MFMDGFLGYRASFMLDFVVVALILVVPLLLYSLWSVKVGHQYARHRNLQLLLGSVLLLAVGLFEIDLHLVQGGWQNVVAKRDPDLTSEQLGFVRQVLRVHLVFAISTPFLWAVTIGLALAKFPRPPHPNAHSAVHKALGWCASLDITLTSLTGLIFYYVAFVAQY